MVAEVVKYHNDLNTVVMRTWTSEEMNFSSRYLLRRKNRELKSLFSIQMSLKSLLVHLVSIDGKKQ